MSRCLRVSAVLLFFWGLLLGPASAQSPIPQRLVIENFDAPQRHAPGSDAPYGAFSDPDSLGSCFVFFEGARDKAFGGAGNALLLQWDVSKPGAFGGYWQELRGLNLMDYNYLSFFVRGLSGHETLKVGLRGKANAQYESKIFLHDALKTGITTDWQKILIPLGLFSAVENWGEVSVFSLNFENAFGSGKGQILVDDIGFER